VRVIAVRPRSWGALACGANMTIYDANLVRGGSSGPEGTAYEGGLFPAILTFPRDYPLSPPSMRFTCEMFHPNSTRQERPPAAPTATLY